MKRWTTATALIALLIAMVSPATADTPVAAGTTSEPVTSFDDMPAGTLFRYEVAWLADAGITKGCNPPENDEFCPNQPVTRGQMAAFMVRAFKYTDRGTTDFTDDNGSIFEADIERLAAAGVTKGCNPPENDEFCPNQSVTRGQMAAFMHRAFDAPRPAMRFVIPDVIGQAIDISDAGIALVWTSDGIDGDAALWDPRADELQFLDTATVDRSRPTAMSESGYVVLEGEVAGEVTGYWWNPATQVMTEIIDAGTTSPRAVNELGQTVGWTTASDRQQAMAWSPGDSAATLLETPPDRDSYAIDINDHGMIVGKTYDPLGLNDPGLATAWDIGTGVATVLPGLSTQTRSESVNINNADQIAGVSVIDSGSSEEAVAMRWELGQPGYETLDTSDLESVIGGSVDVYALWVLDLDQSGRVFGIVYQDDAGTRTQRLFVWDPDTGAVTVTPPQLNVGIPTPLVPTVQSVGLLNESNMAAFTYREDDNAGLWNVATGTTRVLTPPPGTTQAEPAAINNSGDVAGWAWSDQFATQPVVWTPPES